MSSFASNGAILSDSQYGFSSVVNQFDEGAHGTVKDIILVDATTFTLDASEHHGKEIRASNVGGVEVTLPVDEVPGFKCKFVLACTNTGGAHSLKISMNSASDAKVAPTFIGLVNGGAVSGTASCTVAGSGVMWTTVLECECCEDPNTAGTYYYVLNGTSVATATVA